MKKTIFIGAIASTLFLLNACSDKAQYENPTQLITNDLAADLSKRYSEERAELISTTIGKQDATAVWYSIEELENYINYVKCEGKEKGIDVNGIRFYLGVYPNDSLYNEKAGLATIFLSPTKKRIVNTNNNKSEKSAKTTQSLEENIDARELQPLNYGGIGHPPRVIYPQ